MIPAKSLLRQEKDTLKHAKLSTSRPLLAAPNFVGLVRSQTTHFSVIPAEAGIQEYQEVLDPGSCPPQAGSPG